MTQESGREGWEKKFRAVGAGSIRFTATREEVKNFIRTVVVPQVRAERDVEILKAIPDWIERIIRGGDSISENDE